MKFEDINKEYLKTKKLLLISDTWYPYLYITDFIKILDSGKVYVYSSPASTAKFIKVYLKVFAKRKVKLIKDKNFNLFFNDKINEYIVVVFFGRKRVKETDLLEIVAKKLLTSYQDVMLVYPDGVDYDEDSPLFQR